MEASHAVSSSMLMLTPNGLAVEDPEFDLRLHLAEVLEFPHEIGQLTPIVTRQDHISFPLLSWCFATGVHHRKVVRAFSRRLIGRHLVGKVRARHSPERAVTYRAIDAVRSTLGGGERYSHWLRILVVRAIHQLVLVMGAERPNGPVRTTDRLFPGKRGLVLRFATILLTKRLDVRDATQIADLLDQAGKIAHVMAAPRARNRPHGLNENFADPLNHATVATKQGVLTCRRQQFRAFTVLRSIKLTARTNPGRTITCRVLRKAGRQREGRVSGRALRIHHHDFLEK
ncbi:exported hypothetical protein [Cupriavidus oxalaticus]|uniref:Uncharacterized protein n=1 Tax=Cupriavidus oxalaticus TaxID=96344 RepID=A0A976BCN0_9BURK|nr:exported hypothetical protein [Cupriavidus oxalaticus]